MTSRGLEKVEFEFAERQRLLDVGDAFFGDLGSANFYQLQAIERRAAMLGCGPELVSVRLTEAPLRAVMSDPKRLRSALAKAIARAIEEDGAEAVVIGGGPLAAAARSLAGTTPVPLIEPLPAAVAAMERLLSD